MGYRSDVVIAVHKKLRTQCFLDKTWPKLLDEFSVVKEDRDVQYWSIEGIKWYPDYPEVVEMENFFSSHCDDAEEETLLAGLRIGEDDNDSESWGDTYEFEICINRSISY